MQFRVLTFLLIVLLSASLCDAQHRLRRNRTPDRHSPAVQQVTAVSDGIIYTHEYFSRTRWSVHTIIADLDKPDIRLMVAKGLDNVAGLERLHAMAHRIDSAYAPRKVRAGVNSNFWKAGSNHVIGPSVVNGIFVNNLKYKNWSSLVYTADRQLSIDRYSFQTSVETPSGAVPVHSVNRRSDSTSVTLYTRFFGPSVPFIDTLNIRAASMDTLTDESELDSTINATIDSLWTVNPEKGTLKVQFRYHGTASANSTVPCVVTGIDTTEMKIPAHGGVLSLGYLPRRDFTLLSVGDSFRIRSIVHPPVSGSIMQMVTGTPRLVRNGRPTVEWRDEGLHRLAFINGRLGRTAVGISRNGKKLVLLTCEATNRKKRIRGMNLFEVARLLVKKGAYQGLNFDGGSSATMLVNRSTVAPPGGGAFSRKVANALFIIDGVSDEQVRK